MTVHNGALIFSYHAQNDTAAAYAQSVQARLAQKEQTPRGLSLSPAPLLTLSAGTRLVLPSPNGAALTALSRARWTLTGGLVNAAAVAAVAERLGERIAVIPAGERWPNGTLRPALEDQLGAGAIIHHLKGRKSPEAFAAEMVFRSSQNDLCRFLRESISGRELLERGCGEDVEIASQLNVSSRVPVLVDGSYRAWPLLKRKRAPG